MTPIVPDLDTTTFDELVERGRSQIPRYAPRWTDHNVHDPGMTLLDLLAWIVDQQVYRVGFVGDRHLEAFARLLGGRADGPTPARGVLWPQRNLGAERALAAGAEVRCATEGDLPFALETALHLSPARLTELVVEGDGPPLVVPDEGDRTTLISLAPSGPGGRSALVLRFDGPLVAMPPAPVSVGFAVEPPPGQPPEPDVHSWGPLRFEHRRGDEPWTEADVIDDGTAALARTGAVVVQVPVSEATTSIEPSELRVVLDGDAIPLERRIRRVAVNALPVVQQTVDVAATLVRGNAGVPDEEVSFDSTDLLDAGSLDIRVGDEAWEQRSTLVSAGPDDRVYVRRPQELVFGNGVNGRIPAADAAIQHGPVTRTRGERARVRAGLAWDVPALGPDGSAFATTIDPIGGGARATDLAGLLVKARHSAISREALLTDDELGAAARLLPGFAVARAVVLDGFHPDVPDRIDGTRTLVVIPHRRREDPAAPPRPAYLAAVRRLLADRRVLGERLVIAGHAIVAVSLDVSLVAQPGVDLDDVRARVAARLRSRFTDVGGPDDIAPWPLGRKVTREEVASLAAVCDGVLAVKSCAIGRAGEPRGEAPIDLDRDEVAVVGEPDLHVEVARS